MENQEKPQFQIKCIEPTEISLYQSGGYYYRITLAIKVIQNYKTQRGTAFSQSIKLEGKLTYKNFINFSFSSLIQGECFKKEITKIIFNNKSELESNISRKKTEIEELENTLVGIKDLKTEEFINLFPSY
jgi:hypothetical protein